MDCILDSRVENKKKFLCLKNFDFYVPGKIVITVNGRVIKDSTETFFKETSSMKPKSFKNRVLLMKSYEVGYWYQSQQYISNVNIFRKLFL